MTATITITYTAIAAPSVDPVAQICATFVPTNAAADLPAFEGTYYDTNVAGFGEAMKVEKFFADSVAHPGIIAAMKLAVANGTYTFTTEDELAVMFLQECTPAIKDQGFEVEIETE